MRKSASIAIPRIGALGHPRQIRISLEPGLAAELDQYAAAYQAHYGERPEIETLIPHILASFMAADRGFKRWKTQREAASIQLAEGSEAPVSPSS